MKVSIQHDMPHDEFTKKFGPIVGAGFDEAHAALLRAQGIKPVNVETTYGSGMQQVVANQSAAPPPTLTPDGQIDLGPLYGLFIQLADALTETRQLLEDRTIAQERINQVFAARSDEFERRLSVYERVISALAGEAERRLDASAA